MQIFYKIRSQTSRHEARTEAECTYEVSYHTLLVRTVQLSVKSAPAAANQARVGRRRAGEPANSVRHENPRASMQILAL